MAARERQMWRQLKHDMRCDLHYRCVECPYIEDCVSRYWDGRIRICPDGHRFCGCPHAGDCIDPQGKCTRC